MCQDFNSCKQCAEGYEEENGKCKKEDNDDNANDKPEN